jgi:hypothetical protein
MSGLDRKQFRELIIKPALEGLQLDSKAAQELLLGTAIQESGLKYLHQLGNGPALGVFQMEPATHDDIWENYLAYRPTLAQKIPGTGGSAIRRRAQELVGNLWYAAGMCRVHYLRAPDPLPEAGDLEGQAAYWKKFYNTVQGAGTVEHYIRNWRNAHN